MAGTHSANGEPKAKTKRPPAKTRAERKRDPGTSAPRPSRAESNRLNAKKAPAHAPRPARQRAAITRSRTA